MGSLRKRNYPNLFDFKRSKEPQGEDSGETEELIGLIEGDTRRFQKRVRTTEEDDYASDEEEPRRITTANTSVSEAITPVKARYLTHSLSNENFAISAIPTPVVEEPVSIKRGTNRRAKLNVDPQVRAFIESQRADADHFCENNR